MGYSVNHHESKPEEHWSHNLRSVPDQTPFPPPVHSFIACAQDKRATRPCFFLVKQTPGYGAGHTHTLFGVPCWDKSFSKGPQQVRGLWPAGPSRRLERLDVSVQPGHSAQKAANACFFHWEKTFGTNIHVLPCVFSRPPALDL